ncbi:MAG: hypothetical protein RMJ88_16225, partial [Thermogemmata sp.]|nr:hypothetical protein [Thermogemmata sp.]
MLLFFAGVDVRGHGDKSYGFAYFTLLCGSNRYQRFKAQSQINFDVPFDGFVVEGKTYSRGQ